MAAITSLQSLILDLPPSCVEFWPLCPRFAVVGTYNLEKSPTHAPGDEEGTSHETEPPKAQERNGSILLVEVNGDRVNIVQTVATPFAVLDIHFAPEGHPQSLFGVASSTGSIGLYRLTHPKFGALDDPNTDQSALPKVIHIQTVGVSDPSTLVTAFQWHSRGCGSKRRSLVACLSLTDGTVAMEEIPIDTATTDRISEQIGGHDLEAWTIALTHDGTGIYSGGDDSVLAFWDVIKRSGQFWPDNSNLDVMEKIEWKDRKIHGAGVTAILPLQTAGSDSLVVTGSYDDHIRLIGASAMSRRRVLAETHLGGGVWRLKQLNKASKTSPTPGDNQEEIWIFASCMHAGARILRLCYVHAADEWRFEVLAKFEEHKSMNYGSDCQPSVDDHGRRTFITTSFYDRLLCLWRY